MTSPKRPTLAASLNLYLAVALLIQLTSAPTYAQAMNSEAELPDEKVLELFRDELSGALAKDHVIEISRFHRIQGSQDYSVAASYVLETLRSFGLEEDRAWIESFPSDGKISYQTWQSPSGWNIDSGELHMVEPTPRLLVRYPEIGMSVITYSNPGHVLAEVVDVGSGTSDSDYDGKDVRGRFVLATGYGGEVHRLAVLKYGAAAVVCFLDAPLAVEHPDMIGYTGIWPRSTEIPRVTFGFNISNRQGRTIKELLSNGQKVILEGTVIGRGLEPGQMDVVVAIIPGSEEPEKELIYTAHLDNPKASANDNASGSAALIDMIRTFNTLTQRGKLPNPRKTIRFLWVPKFFGTMAYLDAHPELRGPTLGGQVLANLNLDMVGENLELLHSRMNITWTPNTISSALTDLTALVAARVDDHEASIANSRRSNFNYRVVPFRGGSDHVIFNDGSVGVPAMMIGHYPDYTHHTTEDTPDKVDPVELERSELIASAVFWTLATLSPEQSVDLANLVAANSQRRLIRDSQRAASWILGSPIEALEVNYHEARRVIDFALERENQSLQSLLDFSSDEQTFNLVETWSLSLIGQAELQRRTLHAIFYQIAGRLPTVPNILSGPERQASKIIPARLTRGPLASGVPEFSLGKARKLWYLEEESKSLDRYLLVNLIDGSRSILDIRNDLSAMTEPTPLQTIERFILDLESAGVIELRSLP